MYAACDARVVNLDESEILMHADADGVLVILQQRFALEYISAVDTRPADGRLFRLQAAFVRLIRQLLSQVADLQAVLGESRRLLTCREQQYLSHLSVSSSTNTTF